MNITQYTYGQLFSHIRRFLVSRGGDILADDQAIMDYINFAIQDLYNEDSSVFRYVEETLEGVSNGEYIKYVTTFPIHKIQKCYRFMGTENQYEYNGNAKRMVPTLFGIKDVRDLVFGGNEILTHKEVTKIRVFYLKDYEPATLSEKARPIPVPYRYIPAIIKMALDWAAPINLMSSESATTDFYSHGINRFNKINQQDGVTDYLDVDPAYSN